MRTARSQTRFTLAIEDEFVSLEFVTWWDTGAYYTGRIEVVLMPEEKKKAKRGKRHA